MSKIIHTKKLDVIRPQWDINNISAFTTTVSSGYSSENTADFGNRYINNNKQQVIKNISLLEYGLPNKIKLLKQIHSNKVMIADSLTYNNCYADAMFSKNTSVVCAVLTADCVPILLTNKKSSFVAAIHAGWRGILKDIIRNTISVIDEKDIVAWIGPSICKNCYEVKYDFRDNFVKKNNKFEKFFYYENNKIFLSLQELCGFILTQNFVSEIFYSNLCSYCDDRFFSARRDGDKAGRMISCIWRI